LLLLFFLFLLTPLPSCLSTPHDFATGVLDLGWRASTALAFPKRDSQSLKPLAFRVLYRVQLALFVNFGVVIDAFAAVALCTAGVFSFPYASHAPATLATFLVRIFSPFDVADW
jgi:hypothetical protein